MGGMSLSSLSVGKQKKLDDWAADCKAKDWKLDPIEWDPDGKPKPTKEEKMMADIGGELTEPILDAALAKVKGK